MGRLVLLTITMVTVVLAQHRTYRNQPIPSPSGLFFEGLSKIRMIKGRWTILTSLDVEDLHRHAEPLNAVNSRYGDVCFDIVNECRIYYLKLHKWRLADMDIKVRWEQLADFLRPFDNVLETEYLTYTSNITIEEREYLDSVVPYLSQTKQVNYEKQTIHIPSGLKDIVKTLDFRKEQVRSQLTILAELKYKPEEGIDLFSNITETTDSIVELRTYLYESLIEVITSTKNGLIHPLTFVRNEFRKALSLITPPGQEAILPVPHDGLGLTQLQNMIHTRTVVKRGRIIIIVNIPFVEQQESNLYYLHSHPVLQRIGLETKVFGQVNGLSSYLLIKNHTQQYGYPTLQYLTDQCKRNSQYMICYPSLVLYPINDESHCEISLIRKSISQPHLRCDIGILPSTKNQWVTLNRPGEWLYSLTKPVSGRIICGKAAIAEIELSNYGKITLRRGCRIFTSEINLTSSNSTQNNPFPKDIIPNATLILNELFPEINNHEDLFRFDPGDGFTKQVPLILVLRAIAQKLYYIKRTVKIIEPDWNWRIMAIVALVLSAFIYVIRCTKTADQLLGRLCCREMEPPFVPESLVNLQTPIRSRCPTHNFERDNADYAIPPSPRPIPSPNLSFNGPLIGNERATTTVV